MSHEAAAERAWQEARDRPLRTARECFDAGYIAALSAAQEALEEVLPLLGSCRCTHPAYGLCVPCKARGVIRAALAPADMKEPGLILCALCNRPLRDHCRRHYEPCCRGACRGEGTGKWTLARAASRETQ